MAGQLPRPWFRLGPMTRPTTATTSAPIPDQPRPISARVRPPIIRPVALTDTTEPTTPQRPKSPPRRASVTPPVKNVAPLPRVLPSPSNGQSGGTATASPMVNPSSPKGKSSSVVGSPATNNSKQPSPFPSPSIPKSIPAVPTPYQSPKSKASASPPSPLVLPPPQLQSLAEAKHETIPEEVERKTVVFQKVMENNGSQAEHHITNYHTHTRGFDQNGKQESNKSDDQKNKISKDKAINGGNKKTSIDSSIDNNTRVITMAGENKGAFMEIILSSDKNSSNITNSPKDNKSKIKSRNVLPMKAFFNSNVQGINNSILMDSKFTHHDPGIHLVFSSISPSADDEDDQGHQ